MLKQLELVGFKSFADKTQLDFAQGLTAVVGPNGSGKSNIVDAVRWVLGEQSAKSLRGGEMADVIFNGSTSRRSLGLAEVTMTFDNSRRLLATDADEVQITRRVYRDGEGEYLINQQLSRLRDIKELFLGSGAGADAYCIIEQGRVDVLLQASTKERRSIFEEAAGISRFKAKKIETLRKLERVDQNLERLKDILSEVEKQLRSVKLQASKAQRYQEHTKRLQELRIGLGLQEYHLLAERLQVEGGVLDSLRAGLAEQAAQAELWESQTRQLEEAIARLDESVHEHEALLADARQRIATDETTLSHEWTLSADLETDLARTRKQLMELSARVATLATAAAQAAEEMGGVEGMSQKHKEEVARHEGELQAVVLRHRTLQDQIQADKAEHLEQMRHAARLQNDAVSFKAQVDNLRRERERLHHKTQQAAQNLASIDVELRELSQAEEVLQARLVDARQRLAEQRQEREGVRQQMESANQLIGDLRAQRSGLNSRIEVLEGLEKSHEGLGTGVREVIALLERPDPGLWRTVCAMVADLLTVRHEYAPLIDLALGERAQRFLVRDSGQLEEALKQQSEPFSSQVSFFPRPTEVSARPDLPSHAGIIASADQLATCTHPELPDLAVHLLGKTLVVRDLASAREIAAQTRGLRFITLQGELLDADGTLTVGKHHAETGILSRKSELRELREQAVALDRHAADTERQAVTLRDQVAQLDSQAEKLQEEIDVLAEQAADLRSRVGQHRQKREGLHEEVVLSRTEISGIEQEVQGLEDSWQRARSQAEEAESRVSAIQTRLDEAEREIRAGEHLRQQRQQECTQARVALAQVEERLTALRARHRQVQTDLEQRQQECSQGEQHLHAARQRLVESQQTMLKASSSLAMGYLEKETAECRLVVLGGEREQLRQRRQHLFEQSQAARAAWKEQQEQAHARELEVNDLKHHRDTLVERLREDYQVELTDLYLQKQSAPAGPTLDANAVNEEIAELRRKLSRLGTVNLDSLQELAELETRATSLKTQYDDLTAAKASLEEIISKINQDSRRLFTESLSAIRTHFQELFRKLFGGGMADIVLEDENDILECGIEIIARPPGKELRSISLMSGGEKTLTAVALLLAIFRSKPSPFCILDEVDAALDEANIGRFTAVLREFLDRSQFIIITHSKRTMASADVLYGVTMQESGVSKRVAVRFEDWPDDNRNGTEPEMAAASKNGH